MPNWCYNTIELEAPQREIDKLEKHLDDTAGKEWFSYFLQIPEESKDEWYGWNIENYGCKWNCDAIDWNRTSDTSISFTFDSPWGPPIALYKNIESIELESESGYIDYYKVNAQYLEEGMQFIGRFIDGEDEYYEYSDLESLDDIPEELVENWGIRDRMLDDLEWAAEQEEEDDSPNYPSPDDDEIKRMEQTLEELKIEFDKLAVEEDNNGNEKTEEPAPSKSRKTKK